MSFSRVYSAQTHLLKGKIVTIEVDITKKTLHAFTLVGLPDKAVDESKDRMSSALKNSGFKSPKNQNQKVVISLSPADLKKKVPIRYNPHKLSAINHREAVDSEFPFELSYPCEAIC